MVLNLIEILRDLKRIWYLAILLDEYKQIFSERTHHSKDFYKFGNIQP